MSIDYAAGGRLRKLRPDKAWATIERLAQYEDEGWNDAFIPVEMSLNYENPNIKQLLGIMEHKVDTLIKDAISLMGRSESIFWMTTNEMYRPPSEPSRQEEFEHIVMNFILDQEERVKQLEEYMKVIVGDFMQLSSEVTRGLKEKTMSKRQMSIQGQSSSAQEVSIEEKTSLIGSSLPDKTSINHSSTPSVPTPSSGLNGEILFVYDPNHLGVRFRLGGEQKEISLWELGWRVSLYSERQSRENATLSGLRNGDTVKKSHLLMEFCPTIGDGGFNVGNTKVASIRDPRVKLAHRCITTTLAGRKETTHRGVRDKNLIYGWMLVTRIARSFGLLTNELRDALSIEPPPYLFKNKSLISMGVIIELQNGICVWPTPWAVEEEEEADEEAEGGMDRQDEQRGRLNTWMGQQDERVHWMYDHTVRQLQYLSTRDNLNPHLQSDPFPGYEADYPPYGYHGYMPPGYAYRLGPSHDGSS
ncbi:hypothetical protein Tco_1354728 [Tanacetum coccineum]